MRQTKFQDHFGIPKYPNVCVLSFDKLNDFISINFNFNLLKYRKVQSVGVSRILTKIYRVSTRPCWGPAVAGSNLLTNQKVSALDYQGLL